MLKRPSPGLALLALATIQLTLSSLARADGQVQETDTVRIFTTAATPSDPTGGTRVHFQYCEEGTRCHSLGRDQGYTSGEMRSVEEFAKNTRHREKVSLFSYAAFFSLTAAALTYLPGWQGKVLPVMVTVGGAAITAMKTKLEDVSDLALDGTEILDPESAQKLTGRRAGYLGREIKALLDAAEPALALSSDSSGSAS